MPGRETPLVSSEYYHIFNRGVAKQITFLDDSDYRQAYLDMDYYRYQPLPFKLSRLKRLEPIHRYNLQSELDRDGTKLVDIISYVFMPNHWHMLLMQKLDGGISKYIGKFSNSYTRYFNTKHNRVGSLFQGPFKSVRIESEPQLLHISRYIHLNPVVSGVIQNNDLLNYAWSSYPQFLNPKSSITNSSPILNLFKSPSEYTDFIQNHIDYARELELIKHQLLDMES